MSKADDELDDEIRPEYDASALGQGVRGKHLKRFESGTNLALSTPEVRAAFPTDAAVNEALSSLRSGRDGSTK